MREFKDNKGRVWPVEINVATVKRVRDLAKVDLLKAADGDLLGELALDPVKLVDTLFVICKPKADADGISDEDFGAAMAGDAIDAAVTAFLEELVDFFPKRRRGLMEKALAKMNELMDVVVAKGEEKLESGDLERELKNALSGKSSSTSPESPE